MRWLRRKIEDWKEEIALRWLEREVEAGRIPWSEWMPLSWGFEAEMKTVVQEWEALR